MYRVFSALTLVVVLLVGPVLAVLADAPQGGTITDCRYSETTEFDTHPTTGQITERFSTLRSSPGVYSTIIVYSPATFTSISQECIDGFSWVEIVYTSGTLCDFGDTWYYPYYPQSACWNEENAAGHTGWALESQLYMGGGVYGPGRWLEATN